MESTLSPAYAEYQRDIIKSGDGWAAYLFARDIPGADIQALQNVVLERGDGWDAYRFAKDVKGADLVALHKRMEDIHAKGYDIDWVTGKCDHLDRFNADADIQKRLKKQLSTVSKKRKPA